MFFIFVYRTKLSTIERKKLYKTEENKLNQCR
jgi:hypothetical protein